MILRRRTTRRVPSGPIADPVELPAAVLGALDEQPGDHVAGEVARERQTFSNSHSTPRASGARRSTARRHRSVPGDVVEGLDDLGGQGQLLDAERALQLGRGAGADDRAR